MEVLSFNHSVHA